MVSHKFVIKESARDRVSLEDPTGEGFTSKLKCLLAEFSSLKVDGPWNFYGSLLPSELWRLVAQGHPQFLTTRASPTWRLALLKTDMERVCTMIEVTLASLHLIVETRYSRRGFHKA
jgi:hypothetical protein